MELFGFIITRKSDLEEDWKLNASRVRLMEREFNNMIDDGKSINLSAMRRLGHCKGAMDTLGNLFGLMGDGK